MKRTQDLSPADAAAGPDFTGHTGGLSEIASFPSYPEAEAAVDALADEGFPVENLSIVAEDLEYVEDITGHSGYADAAFRGLTSGAVIGALLGFFLGLFEVVEPLVSGVVLGLWGLVLGAALGALFGAASMWLSEGRRNFASVSGVRADRYVVLCDPSLAVQAVRLLGSATGPRR